MFGHLWQLPLMRRVPPLWRGVLATLALELLLASAFVFTLRGHVDHPRGEFLSDLAGIGATIFVAFVIEMSVIVLWSTRYDVEDDALSGETVGFGFAALLGIGFALALTNHDHAQALTFLEELGFSWSLVSLAMLAVLVAVYPLVLYERNRPKASPEKPKST
jgi:membrane protein YdbS with pleckstrin-like domain